MLLSFTDTTYPVKFHKVGCGESRVNGGLSLPLRGSEAVSEISLDQVHQIHLKEKKKQ